VRATAFGARIAGVCLVLVACSSSTPSTTSPGSTTSDDITVAGNGVSIHVHRTGPAHAAHAVIAVHGGPGLDAVAMTPYEQLAGPGRRVVTYDQRGAGRSSAPADGDYGIEAQVADLEAIRASLGDDQVDLIGESWGGAVVAAYAAEHPEHVRALVLVGAVPLDRAELRAGQQRFLSYVAHLQGQGLVPRPLPSAVDGSCLPTVRATLPAYAADPRKVPQATLGTCTAATSRATYDAFLADPAVDRLASALAAYRGRAMVVMGDHDAFGLQWLHRDVALLSGATVDQFLVVNAGHVVASEQPAQLFARITTFLRS
jgi:pimeloyl-ACP methyl ester carboxylesterase